MVHTALMHAVQINRTLMVGASAFHLSYRYKEIAVVVVVLFRWIKKIVSLTVVLSLSTMGESVAVFQDSQLICKLISASVIIIYRWMVISVFLDAQNTQKTTDPDNVFVPIILHQMQQVTFAPATKRSLWMDTIVFRLATSMKSYKMQTSVHVYQTLDTIQLTIVAYVTIFCQLIMISVLLSALLTPNLTPNAGANVLGDSPLTVILVFVPV